MIKLTGYGGEPIYIAPEHIRVIQPNEMDSRECRTRVYFGDENYRSVRESPDEVARKVLEYRLFMEQYKACENLMRLEDANYVEFDLMALAGLRKDHAV